MHAFLIVAAIVLAGQVTEASGTRYGPGGTTTGNSTSGNQGTVQGQQAPRQNWSNEGQPLRATTPQPVLPPQQPGQPGLSLPAAPAADYRSQGPARGQQQPATSLPVDPVRSDTVRPTVTPQSNDAPLAESSDPKIKPSQLMRSLLKPPASGQLAGKPLQLAEAVSGARSRDEQTRRVEAYWDLSAAVTEYYLALRETTDHGTLRQSVTRPSPQWEQSRQSFDERVQVARRSAQAAQFRLQRMLGRSENSPLPLPGDMPHCGAYNTRFDQIFGGRPQAPEAQQLHELLSRSHHELRSQAAGVAAAHQWLMTVSERRDPQTDGTGLLNAHELLLLRRRAFVDTVRSYNTSIARYTEIASPGQVETGRLVAMLIHTKDNTNKSWNQRGIRRTSAEEAIASGSAGDPPSTFAERQRNQSNRVETRQEGAERSILTKSQGEE